MFSKIFMVMIIVLTSGFNYSVKAGPISIHDIQYTIEANGDSPQNGNIIDCFGGIVTHKRPGGRPRLIIQDTLAHDWNAIQVKGWTSDAFDNVNVGDWIYLTNVLVEEFKGTTFLQYQSENNAGLTVISTNNPLPKPAIVNVNEIQAPVEGIDEIAVNNHNAEKYESVLIEVVDVNVQDLGYGKAYDNYILTNNKDPNLICWVSDYMNNDNGGSIYHPDVFIGQGFSGVMGILEQFTSESDGIYYDYYQLLTLANESFIYSQTGDFDGDYDVDFDDFNIFLNSWKMFERK